MIDEISLTNFKGFKSATVPLSDLTILSGLNSSGKSTLLQALGLLRQSSDAGFLDEGEWLLNGPFVELGVGSDVLHEDNDTQEMGIGLVENREKTFWKVGYDRQGDVLRPIDPYAYKPTGVLFSDKFQFLRADRLSPQTTSAKSRHAVSRNGSIGAKGEYAAHFLALRRDTSVAAQLRYPGASETTPGLLSQVNAWMQEFSPGVRVDVHDVAGTDFVRLSFAFGTGLHESNEYRPTNVGFGLAYSLPIVVACLATNPGGLVLLENPEAHLHPQGQMAMGRLVAAAAAAGTQVVVETHSDHLLNGVRLAVKQHAIRAEAVRLHFFKRDLTLRQSTYVSPTVLQSGKLSFWPEGFFDQWDRALLDLVD